MSYSMKLSEGDIALKGNTVDIVYGTPKLEQDLVIWLKERFQSDRFHPSYGSILDDYIGGVIRSETSYEIETEVERVLRNYQALQYRRYQENPQLLSADEILAEINSVEAKANYDSIEVRVVFTTYSTETGQFSFSLDT